MPSSSKILNMSLFEYLEDGLITKISIDDKLLYEYRKYMSHNLLRGENSLSLLELAQNALNITIELQKVCFLYMYNKYRICLHDILDYD